MKEKVVVGMSGGVDSSVAAYLLKEKGYDVIGVTMQVWQEDEEYELEEGGCCSLSAVEDARMVCYKLDIPFYVMNFRDIFREKVIENFKEEYLKGRTPNPCIECNKYIKFDDFLRRAQELGAKYIATGHYANILFEDGRYQMKNAKDNKKDQTYMLYPLTQYQLERTLMPCGEYTKDRIREIAKEKGLIVHNKKDSEDICFVKDNDHGKYIKENTPFKIKEGNFKDKEGKVLGKHKGIIYYTIGQRKGLNIACGKPVFISEINADTNEIIVGDEKHIFSSECIITENNLIKIEKLDKEMEVEAKVRYAAKKAKATIIPLENGDIKVVFKEPQRAITKGQSVVFYDGEYVVGGGKVI